MLGSVIHEQNVESIDDRRENAYPNSRTKIIQPYLQHIRL